MRNGKTAATSTDTSTLSSVMFGALHGIAWVVFALNLPFLTFSQNVLDKVYRMTPFQYDPAISLFDNTYWTYGTDYALATITSGFAVWILRTSNRSSRDEHKRLARISA